MCVWLVVALYFSLLKERQKILTGLTKTILSQKEHFKRRKREGFGNWKHGTNYYAWCCYVMLLPLLSVVVSARVVSVPVQVVLDVGKVPEVLEEVSLPVLLLNLPVRIVILLGSGLVPAKRIRFQLNSVREKLLFSWFLTCRRCRRRRRCRP